MERTAPPPKDNPVSFSLPSMQSANDASQAAAGVLKTLNKGELTPIEASCIMGVMDSYRRTLECTDIEVRLQALESELANSA